MNDDLIMKLKLIKVWRFMRKLWKYTEECIDVGGDYWTEEINYVDLLLFLLALDFFNGEYQVFILI